MWSDLERYRNQFLQMQLKNVKPQRINEMVHNEIIKAKSTHECAVDCPEDSNKCDFYFRNRSELAYGFWALPKLMKELNSDDLVTQWKAINSLSEYVVNPLHAERAIQQFDIVRRCQNIFLRIRMKYPKERQREIARLLVIFYYVAKYRTGVQQILRYNHLLDEFYTIVINRETHLEATSKILPYLSEDRENCLQLIEEYKVFDKLWNIWNKKPCISYYPPDLWLHLTHVLELSPEEGIKTGFFEVLYKRICDRSLQYHVWDIKCFGLLLRCNEGQNQFLEVDGIKFLYTILNEEALDSYENVVFALMHGLLTKSSLWRCREFTNFPLILTKLAKDSENNRQQLFCLQALRGMGTMPVIKRFIKENCYDDIKNLKCTTCNNERERVEIVHWLEREIYHTSDLTKKFINSQLL